MWSRIRNLFIQRNIWVPAIKIFEQEDFVNNGPYDSAMLNMEVAINAQLYEIMNSFDRNLIKIEAEYAASEEADFHLVVIIHYVKQVERGN